MPWQVLPNQTEIVAIHAALLPTSPDGDVLYFGDWVNVTKKDAGPTLCRIYHMASQTVEGFNAAEAPTTNAFCAGQAFMARGWLLVGGGTVRRPDDAQTDVHDHLGHWDGERACWVYRPDLKRWIRVKDLNFQPGSPSKGGGRWYPMLVALGNGEVFAAGGHPSYTDDYAPAIGGGGLRHNNNTPERYSPSTDTWTMITSGITALNGVETDEFPRFRLLPSGLLFTACPGIGAKRLFDPIAGQWTGPNVNVAALPNDYGPGPAGRGSSVTSVLLPLLPPNYVPRVLATNSPHPTSFLIEINANPAWQAAPARQGTAAGRLRSNACAVVLPTGQVVVVGGTRPNPNKVQPTDPDALGVLEPELYTPDIDWTTGDFTGPGSWATVNEAATITRGYHSVALLLPDGRVWTAGTTEGWVVGLAQAEKRVEVFSPWYVGQLRSQILPSSAGRRPRPGSIRSEGFNYGETFALTVTGTISRVALLRCGSVTHGYDSDQRYIGLEFSQQGDQLAVTAPPDGNTAPPGYYMLWVIDASGVPCERARFVHLPKIRRLPKKTPIHVRPNKPKHPSVGPKKGVGPKRGPGPKKGVAPKKRVLKKRVGPKKRVVKKHR